MSTGLKANNDGSAAIQVGGTDYITISSAGAVAIPVSLTIAGQPAGGNYNLVQYTSPASGPTGWDATAKKAAGLKAIKVTVVGAGGNGGSGTNGVVPAPFSGVGGGGGGGGAAIKYLPASSIAPGSITVTAGPGTNSFGPWDPASPAPTVTTSATAGSAGGNGTNNGVGDGGLGGIGSNGDANIEGNSGMWGNPSFTKGGIGGASILGGGGRGSTVSTGAADSGGDYGGGGGGGARLATGSPGATTPGGTGAPGIVIIEEFY